MAEAVVDNLETVEVKKEHGGLARSQTGATAEHLIHSIREERAIGQSGQRFMQGVIQQALLGNLAARDVSLRARHAIMSAIAVPGGDSAGEHPAIRAIAVLHAV